MTEKELIFKSHNLNIQNHQLIIPLNQVTGVKASLTYGVIPNGLTITTKTTTEEFVVYNRRDWVRKINETIPGQC